MLWVRAGRLPAGLSATAAPPVERTTLLLVEVGQGFSSTVTPLRKLTVRPGMAGMRSPGTRMPARLRGVSSGYGDCGLVGAGSVLVAGLAEAVGGFGEGVLLAERAGDKAAAADFAAGFETAEDGEQVAPPGGVGFACEEFAEEDAVAAEEDAGVGVEGSVGLPGRDDGGLRGGLGILRIPRLRSETWGTRSCGGF